MADADVNGLHLYYQEHGQGELLVPMLVSFLAPAPTS